ncbi:MbnP family copper-binding protein [Iodobacter sp. LRB]|uniref:MbnP family copper-binding protein n=1 Tax=unclassified Iodobacter TaxID=235634 RepID=UPI000C1002D8|nr:MbnP family copper-binding protein [Iodobacter sp. BJB302]PHV02771.1 metallo-mystery pair system four-Cys motif protein [Iodobacter sp. BJB302]
MRLYATLAVLILSACNSSSDTETPPVPPVPLPDQTVSVQFALKAGVQAVECNTTLPGLGLAATPAKLRDARLYVHDIKLINALGKEVPLALTQNDNQYLNVALLDFENKTGNCAGGTAELNRQFSGIVPGGQYIGLSFKVGVPDTAKDAAGKDVVLNHSDTMAVPAPLNNMALGWSWQAGRRFVQLELNPDVPAVGGKAVNWYFHLGATGCTADAVDANRFSCSNPNLVPVRLSSFDVAKQQVVLDLAALLQGVDISKDAGGSNGCMSGPTDPECGLMFANLDLNLNESAAGKKDAGLPKGDGSFSKVFKAALK